MAVSAKFKVSRVTYLGGTSVEDAWGTEIEMTPDYADGKNKDWAKATPSGVFRMTVTNKNAVEQLYKVKSVDILITPADE